MPQRKTVSQLVLASVVILILAQMLVGALSLTALNRMVAGTTVDRVELSARQSAARVQAGLSLGKPLAQYFGLGTVLQSLDEQVVGLSGASIVLPDGQVVAAVGRPPEAAEMLARINGWNDYADQSVSTLSSGAVRQFSRDQVRLAIPLAEPDTVARGALVLEMSITDATGTRLLIGNAMVLSAITVCAALVLLVVLRHLVPAHILVSHVRVRKAVPIVVLLLAQGFYASYTISQFRTVWLNVTQDNAQLVVDGIQRDLDKVLSYGISPQRLIGVEDYLSRVAKSFPLIQELRLRDRDQILLARVNAGGVLPTAVAVAGSGDNVIQVPLHAGPGDSPVAMLDAILDPVQLRAGVWARVLDAGTVAIIAIVAAMELLLLLELAMSAGLLGQDKKRHPGEQHTGRQHMGEQHADGRYTGAHDAQIALLARPVMFGFLFAWALPLSFLPLYARSLISSDTSPEQLQLLMASPIVAEMGCGLLMVLLAGRLSDRYGWQRPVVIGLLISIVASLACAMASSLGGFVAARSLVGVGYGLAWMGLQGFVVMTSPVNSRGRNMASIIAGLFAGHLSGIAVGAMLMQQFGARTVFQSGALLYCLPLLGALFIVRLRRRTTPTTPSRKPPVSVAVAVTVNRSPSLRKLLLSRDFGLLLLASIVPFSIAQVGLLSFALPLYLEAGGFEASSVGRVLMLYGLCVIYVGPLMGRLSDRSFRKKYWIVAAGLVGSAGLLNLALLGGVSGAVVAVLCLAFASCLAAGAQTSYMLELKKVERYGAVGATSLMRAADKVGQMLGPLVVAGLFAMISMSAGLALTGVLYLVASLVFMFGAPRNPDHQGTVAEPAE